MAVANVALTDTFDVWRTRTNQIAFQSNGFEGYILNLYERSNNSPSYVYANNIGVQANAFASAAIASNNITVGAGANVYASLAANGANAYMIAVQNGANTAVGQGANSYLLAVISGANTAVGNGANSYAAIVVGGFANTNAANGTYISTGAVKLGVGGTSAALTARAGAVTYSTASALALTLAGTTGQVLTSGGTGAPTWTNQNALDVSTAAYATSSGSATSATTFTSTSQNSQFNSIGVGTTASGTAGTITATGDIIAFSSDARLKGDIQTITDALSKVKLITGVTYIHNDIAKSFGYTDESRFAGVLAQEVEAVLPEVVVPAPFDVADDGTSKSGENYKTVKYEKIVPLLIEAIKELTAKVEMLESRVNE